MKDEWNNFNKGIWNEQINVSEFINSNYKGYNGNEEFLESITEKTNKVWSK